MKPPPEVRSRVGPVGGRLHTPSRVIVHAMGEWVRPPEPPDAKAWPAWTWLEMRGLSAHAIVTPSGVVVRTRHDTEVAWHAKGHNTGSLGVEILCPGIHDIDSLHGAIAHEGWVTEAAYMSAVWLVRQWLLTWRIPAANVLPHSALDAAKQDPGDGFPWDSFLADISMTRAP